MAKSSNYRVQLRRRRQGKTDYQARKAQVISGKPRLVTRASIKNITAQIIIAKPKGDLVLAAANSRELIKNFGWKAPTGNIPAAYLTGYLCGLKAKAAGIEEAILDIGLVTPTKGSKAFSVLSGVLDAGLDVPHNEEKIVKERVKGEHIAKYAKTLSADSEEYTAKFTQYTAKGVAPEKMPEHISKVKAEIANSFKAAKPAAEEAAPAPEEKAAVAKEKPAPKAKETAKEKPAKATPKEKASPKAKAASKAKAAPKEKATKKGGKKE